MLHPVVLQKLTDVSEVFNPSIIRAMVMDVVSTSEMGVNFYQAIRRNIPEYSQLPSELPFLLYRSY
jgi:hypothetical protein